MGDGGTTGKVEFGLRQKGHFFLSLAGNPAVLSHPVAGAEILLRFTAFIPEIPSFSFPMVVLYLVNTPLAILAVFPGIEGIKTYSFHLSR